jgi:hypothetical protein
MQHPMSNETTDTSWQFDLLLLGRFPWGLRAYSLQKGLGADEQVAGLLRTLSSFGTCLENRGPVHGK